MEEAIGILSDYKSYPCSPEIARAMHETVKNHTGNPDPYRKIKDRDIVASLNAFPYLVDFLREKQNSLYWALKIAATGNIIDSAIYGAANFEHRIQEELEKEFELCDIERFEAKLKTAKTILIIGDNSGETVFDRVLCNRLSQLDITYSARGGPVINDATVPDALAAGIDSCARVVSTGCCGSRRGAWQLRGGIYGYFRKCGHSSEQRTGNFEALSDCGRDIFFLLKAKCSMISGKLGVGLNSYVLKYKDDNLKGDS
jgi:uncharacterized protein with ATP-grasp and redox domains